MKCMLPIIATVLWLPTFAQNDSTGSPFEISGYGEVYYCYDFGRPSNHLRPAFVYSYNRHNEVNLNLGLIKADYRRRAVRASLSLMAGTYAQYNLAHEHPVLRHLFEASVGARISRTSNLWVDAGVMPSHIGFESAIGINCWNLTRSILADNSPYYETGMRLSYSGRDGKLYLAALLLNGWQRIQRIRGNQTPAFGTKVTYTPDTRVTLNWSTYAGNEFPDSTRRWRYFSNFYSIMQLTQKFGITMGFDAGFQQKLKHRNDYDVWLSPVVIFRVQPGRKIAVAARIEYYSDRQQVIVWTGTPHGFQILGYSANIDVNLWKLFVWRFEARYFSSRDRIFTEKGRPSNNNFFLTSSVAVRF